jgi:hypothetical protein
MAKLLQLDGPVHWNSELPIYDDFGDKIEGVFIDGATVPTGAWGIMTPANWEKHGMYESLGLGKGQKFEPDPNDAKGRWICTEGWSVLV